MLRNKLAVGSTVHFNATLIKPQLGICGVRKQKNSLLKVGFGQSADDALHRAQDPIVVNEHRDGLAHIGWRLLNRLVALENGIRANGAAAQIIQTDHMPIIGGSSQISLNRNLRPGIDRIRARVLEDIHICPI